MTLDELLALSRPPDTIELSREELTRFFWRHKGTLKTSERDRRFWSATNQNLTLAYERLDEKERQLDRAYRTIQDDLLVAQQIQQALLPDESAAAQHALELAVYHRQLSQVGGDYYDFFGSQALGIFDISGHGVSAALVMAYLKALFAQAVHRFDAPADIVEWVNTNAYVFLRQVKRYATMNFVRFGDAHIEYVCGGGFGLLVHRGQPQTFERRDAFLGLRQRPFHQHTMPFEAGDLLALYTDGLVEAQDHDGHDYTVARLNQLILEHATQPVEDILARCIDDYTQFRASDTDDITLVILRRRSA